MSDFGNRSVIFSFISTNEEGNLLSYAAQKKLLAKACQGKEIFDNGELLDTLERRALYPLIHCSVKSKSEVEDIELLNARDFGEIFILKQGVYVESKYHRVTRRFTEKNGKDEVAYIFMGFKSLDFYHNEILENSWKDWTGARIVNACLRKEFYVSRYSFFHRIKPSDTELFMYILMIECHNVKGNNRPYLLDFVQKMRVERVFGYLTVYKRESLSSTSALIKGILSDQDEYPSKVDM